MKASLWSFRATSIGVLCTLLPFLALSLLALHSSPGTASTSAVRPSQLNDAFTALIVLLFSTVVEGSFLIAPFLVASHAVHSRRRMSSLHVPSMSDTRPILEQSPLLYTPHGVANSSSVPVERDGVKSDVEMPAVTVFSSLGFRGFPSYWLLLLIPLMAVVLGLDVGYTFLLQYLHIQVQTNDQALMQQATSAPLTTYATLLVAVLVAPFCEEVFFRSFLLPGLQHFHILIFSVLCSSLLFAMAHVDIGSFVPLFCIGILLGYVRVYSDSIWPSILLHTANNLIASLAVVFSMSLVPVLPFR